MASTEENIIHTDDIPRYFLDSKTNLSQFFTRFLNEYGKGTAMIDVHNGSAFTFDNILNASYNIAEWLKYKCGIQKGDIIGISCENTIWYPSLLLGIWHVGGVCALFNPLYNEKELVHVFNICRPKVTFACNIGLNGIKSAAKNWDFLLRVYVCPFYLICNPKTLEENNSFIPVKYDNSQTSVILFSGGTTGLPKGVKLTHKALYLCMNILNTCYTHTFVDSSDTLSGVVPMFHGYGLLSMCMCMSIGSKLVVFRYFGLDLFLKSIEIQKITVLLVVPPMMVLLAKQPSVKNYNLTSLKAICFGAAPLSLNIQYDIAKKIGRGKPLILRQGYGMTESCILATLHDEDNNIPMNCSVGKLIRGMSGKVIDLKNGKPLRANQCGELCFKGPMIMEGYYDNPEETFAKIDAERWLHTGDFGYYDENHYFYVIGRLKDLINCNGYQVSPAYLESILLTHPEIDDVAVTGLPNMEVGEIPMAFVVKSLNSSITKYDIVNFVNSCVNNKVLREYFLIEGVQFLNTIPKSPSGKILRKELKAFIIKSKL